MSGTALSGSDSHSVNSDPGFLNASGNWNLPSDFKRSSYTANGRGGSYSSVMGAYITGTETIGYSSGDDTTPPTVTSATINTAGTTLTLAMSESVTNNFTTTVPTLSISGGAVTATCNSCSSGTSLPYTLSRTVYQGETGTYSWDVAANGVEDAAGNDLVDISGVSVTNSSTAEAAPSVPKITNLKLQGVSLH